MLGSDKKREPYYGYILRSKPKFLWILDKWTECCTKPFGEYSSSPDCLYGSEIEIKWNIVFVKKKGDNDIDVAFLKRSASNNNIRLLSLEVGLRNMPDLNNYSKMESMFGKTYSGGFDNFFDQNKILEKIEDEEDMIHVSCEMHDIDLLDKSLFVIKSRKLNALNDIGQLYMNKTLCDATIKVDGKEFKVHKAILAAQSKVFAAMFEHNMIEKETSSVDISDIDSEVFEELLKFLYTAEVKTKGIVKELLITADKYNISDLKDICIIHLYYSLNIDNAVDLLMYSEFYDLKELKAKIMNYIIINYTNIVNKPSFKSLEKVPLLLMELERKMASIPK